MCCPLILVAYCIERSSITCFINMLLSYYSCASLVVGGFSHMFCSCTKLFSVMKDNFWDCKFFFLQYFTNEILSYDIFFIFLVVILWERLVNFNSVAWPLKVFPLETSCITLCVNSWWSVLLLVFWHWHFPNLPEIVQVWCHGIALPCQQTCTLLCDN